MGIPDQYIPAIYLGYHKVQTFTSNFFECPVVGYVYVARLKYDRHLLQRARGDLFISRGATRYI